jgi:hypothetical protein
MVADSPAGLHGPYGCAVMTISGEVIEVFAPLRAGAVDDASWPLFIVYFGGEWLVHWKTFERAFIFAIVLVLCANIRMFAINFVFHTPVNLTGKERVARAPNKVLGPDAQSHMKTFTVPEMNSLSGASVADHRDKLMGRRWLKLPLALSIIARLSLYDGHRDELLAEICQVVGNIPGRESRSRHEQVGSRRKIHAGGNSNPATAPRSTSLRHSERSGRGPVGAGQTDQHIHSRTGRIRRPRLRERW